MQFSVLQLAEKQRGEGRGVPQGVAESLISYSSFRPNILFLTSLGEDVKNVFPIQFRPVDKTCIDHKLF